MWQAKLLGLRSRPLCLRNSGHMEVSPQGQPWALCPESQSSHACPACPAHIVGAVDMAFLLDLILPCLQQLGVQHRKARPCVVELQTQKLTE